MWQRISPGSRQSRGGPMGFTRGTRFWVVLGGALILAYLALRLFSGTSTSGPATVPPAGADAPVATPAYLASGYAQLGQAATQTSSPSFWSLWAGMLLPLAIVIVSVYAILRGLKYVNSRIAVTSSSSRSLESIDSLSLGQHGAIHLVRVGSRLVVVGAGTHEISFLTEFESEQAEEILSAHRAHLAESPSSARGVLQSFRDLVSMRITRPLPDGGAVEPLDDAGPVPARGLASDGALAAMLAELQSRRAGFVRTEPAGPAVRLDVNGTRDAGEE